MGLQNIVGIFLKYVISMTYLYGTSKIEESDDVRADSSVYHVLNGGTYKFTFV